MEDILSMFRRQSLDSWQYSLRYPVVVLGLSVSVVRGNLNVECCLLNSKILRQWTVEKAVHLTRSFEVVNIKAILEKLRRQMSVNASHSCPIISQYNNLKLWPFLAWWPGPGWAPGSGRSGSGGFAANSGLAGTLTCWTRGWWRLTSLTSRWSRCCS